jgi:large subunit ribosomal protein L18
MNREARRRRKQAIRKEITGTKNRPRLNVFRSNKHIYAALIDDECGETLLAVSEKDIKAAKEATKTEKAFLLGKQIGEQALKKGYKRIVFDRAGYIYHGRVKRLAEGAREAGLKF